MEFTLRPANAADYEWLWDLKRMTMQVHVEATWGSWDDVSQEAFFRRSFSPETVQMVVVDAQNAGLLHVEQKPSEIFLANIQIHPAFQNRGLGAAVIKTVLDTGRLLSLPVRLQVLAVNVAARELYLRLGFAVVGETSTHVAMRWHPGERDWRPASPAAG